LKDYSNIDVLRRSICFIFSLWVDPFLYLDIQLAQAMRAMRCSRTWMIAEIEYYSKEADVTDAKFLLAQEAPATVAALNALETKAIGELLGSAVDHITGRIVFTTSFGIEDQLLAHHIFTGRLPIEVVTLDTGRLFPETYSVWQETEERYKVRIRAFYPDAQAVADLVADQGINGFYHSRDARLSCCGVRKVEPLGRALAGASAWVTGLRADQSELRAGINFAQWDAERSLIKIAPLFDHDRARVVAECVRLGVPVNELHARCFLSIGCAPCTRAVRPGEPERAGRWWWESDNAKECGVHVDASGRLVRSAAA
jgi:phosphoadenosine phosphosulfate reductase